MSDSASSYLSYGELLHLTEGHGTSVIYERVNSALGEKDAALAEVRATLAALRGALNKMHPEFPPGEPDRCGTCELLTRVPEG